jgi:hypothetical protein
MQFKKPRLLLFTAMAALVLASACSDDPNVPKGGPVAGQYHATTFTVSSSGLSVSLLPLGASLDIALAPDQTTTGRLIVPAAAAGGEALDEDLAGTWRQSNDTVYFSQTADTFVRDVPFVIKGSTLVGSEVTPDGRVDVTLSKYGAD